ncbi:MAG: cytidine deaminase [Pseudomonadota bacterium]
MANLEALFQAARLAMARTYSPYSKFPVGAAIISESGAVYTGCNIENASFPEGWCAETSAISQMIGAGDKRIAHILVTAEKMDLCSPCGGCRQRIAEFADGNTKIHLCDENGVAKTLTMAELLPAGFDLDKPACVKSR